MVELFKYLELESEKGKTSAQEKGYERYLAFLTAWYASPYSNAKDREEFRKSLIPSNLEEHGTRKKEWNFDLLKALKFRQRGGGPHDRR